MSDLFDEEDDVVENDPFVSPEKDIVKSGDVILDARRRLEKMLEEKRLRDELDDFIDY